MNDVCRCHRRGHAGRARDEEIGRLYEAGHSGPALSRRFGLSCQGVYRAVRRSGRAVRPSGDPDFGRHGGRLGRLAANASRADPGMNPRYRKAAAEYARHSGWPVGLRLAETATLNALAGAGLPLTRRELQGLTRLGRGVGESLRSLAVRGLILRLRGVRQSRQGRHLKPVPSYVLSPAALSLLEERVRCRETTA